MPPSVPDDLRPGVDRTIPVACPDCSGVLTARVEGRKGHLVYRCRVGHTYSLAELLAGKEEQLETRLWSALATQEELIELLEDAARVAAAQGIPEAARACRDRAESAREQRDRLRRAIDDNRAVELHDELSRIRADGHPPEAR